MASVASAGRVVHEALARWSCLALNDQQLVNLLVQYAQQTGAANEVTKDAAEKARRMIRHVQRSSLYVDIDNAEARSARYHEVPFTLETEPIPLYGVIDLLYRDDYGDWHLLDWKTEWVGRDMSDLEVAHEHRHQIAAYAVAMERPRGVRPAVSLCFLNPRFRPIPIPVEDVDTAWQEILEGAP